MKIKLDENIPARLANVLRQLGHDVDTIPDEGLAGAADPQVWQAAQAENRFFITQDLDFSNINQYTPGAHHGLLLIRLRNPSRKAILQKVTALFQTEAVAEWHSCLVVATERKIRVRRPPK